MEDTQCRPQMSDNAIDRAMEDVMRKLMFRLDQKGRGIFMSSHEIEGIVGEEVREFQRAVEINDSENQREELTDIAVAAILGIVSRNSGKMDW